MPNKEIFPKIHNKKTLPLSHKNMELFKDSIFTDRTHGLNGLELSELIVQS